ncbi:MAG: flagellar basal body rod protein FlgB [Micrococcales bacterium]|nr:flagellar basal body rod protein FlgB [Micrococcales bacterium]
MFNSVTAVAMNSALNALSQRQRAIANNVANVQTPGFRAQRVHFESALRAAVANGNGAVTATTRRSLEPTRLDGNNVNLETEVLSNIDTNLRYSLAIKSIDGQFSSIRTAMRTS